MLSSAWLTEVSCRLLMKTAFLSKKRSYEYLGKISFILFIFLYTHQPSAYHGITYWLSDTTIGWRHGVVVSGVRHMNEVNARRARLVPGWVTIFGWVYDLGM